MIDNKKSMNVRESGMAEVGMNDQTIEINVSNSGIQNKKKKNKQ